MKVLILCAQSPWPPDGGSPLRSLGWIRTASSFARIGLVYLSSGRSEESNHADLARYCEVIREVPLKRTAFRRIGDLFKAMATGTPYIVQAAVSERMRVEVAEVIEQWQPDIVQAEWIGAAPYLQEARLRGLPTIYGAHNVENQVVAGTGSSWVRRLAPFTAGGLQRCETTHGRGADVVVTVTRQDKKWFQPFGKQVICVPNAIVPAEYSFELPSVRAKGLLVFVGHLRYPPNFNAAQELICSVLPLIREQQPEVRCLIAGRLPPQRLLRQAGRGVSVQADVSDIKTVWNQAAALLSPLRSGGGSRLKLLEAAACGVPIIATPFSAHGLALKAERDFIAVSDPAEMARACLRLLCQPESYDALVMQARETVERNHSWERNAGKLQQLYEDLADHNRQK